MKKKSCFAKKNASILYEIEILLIGTESQIRRQDCGETVPACRRCIGVVQSHQLITNYGDETQVVKLVQVRVVKRRLVLKFLRARRLGNQLS